jgi:hypothetical protein
MEVCHMQKVMRYCKLSYKLPSKKHFRRNTENVIGNAALVLVLIGI